MKNEGLVPFGQFSSCLQLDLVGPSGTGLTGQNLICSNEDAAQVCHSDGVTESSVLVHRFQPSPIFRKFVSEPTEPDPGSSWLK